MTLNFHRFSLPHIPMFSIPHINFCTSHWQTTSNDNIPFLGNFRLKATSMNIESVVSSDALPLIKLVIISVRKFETIWPLTEFYHNRYTLGLYIMLSCISWTWHYFLIFNCAVVEADEGLPVVRRRRLFREIGRIWNGCHVKVRSLTLWSKKSKFIELYAKFFVFLLNFLYLKSPRLLTYACKLAVNF